MKSTDVAVRDLATRMFELAHPSGETSLAEHVCEKLRLTLTRFAGADGFNALFRRALRLGSLEASGLQEVTLQSDGTIRGLDQLKDEEAVVLVACQLDILITLIGERLTLRLLADEWTSLLQ